MQLLQTVDWWLGKRRDTVIMAAATHLPAATAHTNLGPKVTAVRAPSRNVTRVS